MICKTAMTNDPILTLLEELDLLRTRGATKALAARIVEAYPLLANRLRRAAANEARLRNIERAWDILAKRGLVHTESMAAVKELAAAMENDGATDDFGT
jgi:hypothetical protein